MRHEQFVKRCLLVPAALFALVPCALGQGTGGSQGGGTGGAGSRGGAGGGAGTGTRPGPGTQPGREPQFPTQQPGQQQQQQRFPEFQRPIFLQGKVVFDDGTPAPPSVVIERVCNGRPIPEAYTDSKGRFSFQVGHNTAFIPDASVGNYPSGMPGGGDRGDPYGGSSGRFPGSAGPAGGISERDLMGCELRASLPGYRSTSVELTGRRAFDNPDVGQLVLHKLANVEGFTISMTTLQAPKNAKKSYERGMKEASKQKFDKARTELEKATTEYPEYAEAWFALGQVLEAQKQPDQAREAYGKALAADGKFVSPYVKLARMDAMEQKWDKVAETTAKVMKLNPYDFPDAYFYNAVANLNLNKLEDAEKSAREAIKLNAHQRFPQVEHVLGLSLAYQNDFPEARVHLQRYLELLPNAANASTVQQQISQIESFLAKQQAAAPQAAPPQQ